MTEPSGTGSSGIGPAGTGRHSGPAGAGEQIPHDDFAVGRRRSITRPRLRRPVLIALVGVLVVAVLGAAAFWWSRRLPPSETPPAASGVPARTWASGAWTGGDWGTASLTKFATWRGTALDTAVMYPAYDTWDDLAGSDWHVSVFDGFKGKLVYGLPLLPKDSSGKGLDDVAAGKHDDVFEAVADTLLKYGRGDSYIRIGLEANGDWFPWGASTGDNTAESFKAAYRHVAQLLRTKLPDATLMFDISAGGTLRGQSDRLGPLKDLYPGDDVVDVIGVDHYDHYQLIAPNKSAFASALKPAKAAGLQDVADFAKAHGKKFAVPEWGLTATDKRGGGDDPYFIYAMYMWFAANAKNLAFENYFNESADYIKSAIWDAAQNPKAAAEYKELWGPDHTSTMATTPSS